MKKILLTFGVLSLLLHTSFCQKAPVTFGKIDKEDVAGNVYKNDTSAAAVVLADYGWFDINNFTFTQTLRVKILKKAGYDLADFTYYTDERPNVKGMVYNLDGDKVIKEKLPASSFYYKKLGTDSWETSFSIPNVKEGTVFDIQYTYSGLPFVWLFQRTIPVKYSELDIPQSPYLNYSKNFFGYTPLAISTGDKWVATDVPAFREEPYINSRENYMTKMEIEIRSITIPGYVRNYSST